MSNGFTRRELLKGGAHGQLQHPLAVVEGARPGDGAHRSVRQPRRRSRVKAALQAEDTRDDRAPLNASFADALDERLGPIVTTFLTARSRI